MCALCLQQCPTAGRLDSRLDTDGELELGLSWGPSFCYTFQKEAKKHEHKSPVALITGGPAPGFTLMFQCPTFILLWFLLIFFSNLHTLRFSKKDITQLLHALQFIDLSGINAHRSLWWWINWPLKAKLEPQLVSFFCNTHKYFRC